jgi:hypothetical protein
VFGNELFELGDIGTTHFLHFGSILVKLKGGHGGYATTASHFFSFVDIDLDKFNIRIRFRQIFKDGPNVLARSAPVLRKEEQCESHDD